MDILKIINVPYYKEGNTIHIKKENRGKFTRSAKEHNMGVLEFATHVLNNKDKYSPILVKRANFAKNSKKFKHAKGGLIKKCQNGEILDNLQMYTSGYTDPVTITANKKLTKKLQMQADEEWREYLKHHPIQIGSEEYNRLPEKAKAQVYKNSITDAIDRAALPTAAVIIAPTAIPAAASALVGSGALTAVADAAGTIGTKIAGTNLGKAASAFINNPYIDAGLTAVGAYTIPSLYNEGVLNIKEGNYGRAAGDFGSIGLELLGAANTAKNIGNVVSKISPIARSIYNSKKINSKPLQHYTFILPSLEHVTTFIPSTKSQNKISYILLERPSKLSEAELQGLSKYDRTNISKEYDYRKTTPNKNLYEGAAIDNLNFPYFNTDIQEATEEVKNNMLYSNKTFQKNKNNRYEHEDRLLFGVPENVKTFNKDLLEYAKSLPDADPMFLNSNGFLSTYVLDYRRYLNNIGYDANDLSDNDIAKILTLLYKDLTNSMNGKTKGMVVWHSSPTVFELFDFSNTGKYTGNMGYGGPGNYFSAARNLYGGKNAINILPYLINNVLSTPLISVMQEKGLLPYYVSPDNSKLYLDKIEELIKQVQASKTDNKLYIDDISRAPSGTLEYPTGRNSEYMLRRNYGIKSLFPHPSLLVRDNNGKLKIIRNWEDQRVNFKNGGNIFPKRYSNIVNRNIKKRK